MIFLKEFQLTVQRYKKGEITVFLALISIVVCGFIYVVIDGARNAAVKLKMEAVTNLALDSAMSEYNIELWEKYGLLYVDSCYKGISDGGEEAFLSHFVSYIDVNMANMPGITYLSTEIIEIEYASDNQYESVVLQLRENLDDYAYMSDNSIINAYISDHKDLYYEFLENKQREKREQERREIYSEYEEKLETLIYLIEEDMKENCYAEFDFDNLIHHVNLTVFMEGPTGKVYECTRELSLN